MADGTYVELCHFLTDGDKSAPKKLEMEIAELDQINPPKRVWVAEFPKEQLKFRTPMPRRRAAVLATREKHKGK